RERSTERHRAELDPIQPSASARTAAVRRDARHVPEMGLQRTAGDERGLLPQCAVVPDRNRHANVAPRKARPADAHQAHARGVAGRAPLRAQPRQPCRPHRPRGGHDVSRIAVLTFLPVFTQRVFRGGAGTYRHLMAFSGTGSIAGALVAAWLGKFKRMGVTALTMQAICGLLILAFSMSHTIWLSALLLLLT